MDKVALDRSLFNYRGQFYPTNHVFAMLPNEAEARKACSDLVRAGFSRDDIRLLPPETIVSGLADTAREYDDPLPSPGTEGATARHFVDLARQGQWGLLIHAKADSDARIVEVLQGHRTSFAERYRRFVIEDLVGQND